MEKESSKDGGGSISEGLKVIPCNSPSLPGLLHGMLPISIMDLAFELHKRGLSIHHEDVRSIVKDLGMLRVLSKIQLPSVTMTLLRCSLHLLNLHDSVVRDERMMKRSSASLSTVGSNLESGTNPHRPYPLHPHRPYPLPPHRPYLLLPHPDHSRVFTISHTAREALKAQAEAIATCWTLGGVGLVGELPKPSLVSSLFYLINKERAQHFVDQKNLGESNGYLKRLLEGHRSRKFKTLIDLAFCE